jgi:hypothetical protein
MEAFTIQEKTMCAKESSDSLIHTVFTLLLLSFVAGLFSTAAKVAADEPGKFCAACVKVDITPDSPQWLQGYGPRQSTGIHDPIFHRIAILDDGTTRFCLVSTDICIISPSFYDEFCVRLQHDTQIEPENFWWCTTHTHSAPHVGPQDLAKLFAGTLGDRFSIKHDTDYWALVTDKLISGIRRAQSQLEPARLGIGTSTAAANVNRRELRDDGRTVLGVNPEGPVDRQLGLFRLERLDGSLIGLIANYAIHGTALGGRNTLITGDVPGFAARVVEGSTGVPLLFINGALGNVAPLHSVLSNIDDPRLQEFDTLLGERILAANRDIKNATADVTLRVGKTVVETPRRAELGWPAALADYSSTSADGTPQVRIPVYSLSINRDTVIWAAPLELFSEMPLRIRTDSPFPNTFYFGLANGSLMYLPTKAAFAEGGYEPNVSPFTDRAEADFTSAVTRYLGQLKKR